MKELLDNLNILGLTVYEAKCYIALTSANELSPVDVARISGVPRTRTYEILENLMKKGLCVSVPGPVIKYKASNPEMLKIKGNDKLGKIENKLNDFKKKIEKIENEKIMVEEARDNAVNVLSDTFEKSRTGNESFTYKYFEIVRNPSLLYEKTRTLIANARYEILGLTKPKPIDMVVYDESELIAVKKGVVCKNVYELPGDIEGLEFLIDNVQRSSADGEITKIAEELPMDLLIFDYETVMFSIKDPLPRTDSYTCMFAKHKILAEFFALTYKTIWDSAMDPDVLPGILEQRKKQKN